jgi:hypothetical protein
MQQLCHPNPAGFRYMKDQLKQEIKEHLETLGVKKRWLLTYRGVRIKVVRHTEYAFDVYRNGHHVNTDPDWEMAYDLVIALFEANEK